MALISLAGIADAIDNLNFKEATLKGKLALAIRMRFPDEESLDTVTAIDPLDLIHELWAPKTAAEIKAKRKNLSSLKSAINKSLKKGIKSGANPEGIIIGRDNVFIISEEKKNLLLDKLSLDGVDSHSLVSALAAINEMLAGIAKPTDKNEALKILDQLDSTRKTLTRLAGLSEEEADQDVPPAAGGADDQTPVEEIEIDDDTIIEFIEEETISDPEDEPEPQQIGSATGDGEGTGDEGPGQAGSDDLLAGGDDHEASALEDDWNSFEVVDDDLDILDSPDLADLAEESEADVEPVEEIDAEDVLLEEYVEEIDEEELAELPTEVSPGSDMDLGGAQPEGSGDGADEEPAEDWDSFEVVDDDFDILDNPDLAGLDGESEQDLEPVEEDLEIVDEVDEVLEDETDLASELEPVEEIDAEEVELEEITEEDLAELATEPGSGNMGLGESQSEESYPQQIGSATGDGEGTGDEGPGQAGSDDLLAGGDVHEAPALEDDWDSFEVVDDVLEEETDLAPGQEPVEEIDAEEVELEEDIEEIDEEDLAELAPEPGPGGDMGPGEAQPEGRGDGVDEEPADDWDSFEVEGGDLDLRQPAHRLDNQEPGSHSAAQERSMDLSQYIEPEDALVNIPDILQENNDEYVRQILERFMPKFIKIPAGLYPVGDKKRRTTDRSAAQVSLPEFYIGQLPITNDLFDFFVRETGYETEAEQQGHGLVTSGRLRGGLQQKTGRHTLAINKGVITRQIKGANWRHPDGPGSSLENRGHHPVVQVSRLDAMAFASWAGKRLPSEDEWEAAARGLEGLLFPWGNEALTLANLEGHQAGSTTPVNYFGRQSLSPFGLLDMLGNVFEWTLSNYDSQNGRELYVLKGGSWATAQITCADRLIEPATWTNTIGFRCAVDAD